MVNQQSPCCVKGLLPICSLSAISLSIYSEQLVIYAILRCLIKSVFSFLLSSAFPMFFSALSDLLSLFCWHMHCDVHLYFASPICVRAFVCLWKRKMSLKGRQFWGTRYVCWKIEKSITSWQKTSGIQSHHMKAGETGKQKLLPMFIKTKDFSWDFNLFLTKFSKYRTKINKVPSSSKEFYIKNIYIYGDLPMWLKWIFIYSFIFIRLNRGI